jgi:hypothetical protein
MIEGENAHGNARLVGGGDNLASNPGDWIDPVSRLPQAGPAKPGDTLVFNINMGSPQTASMNIAGNDLAGDPLSIGFDSNFTANLSHQAVVTAGVNFGRATFNVTDRSSLSVTGFHAAVTVNLSQNSTAHINPAYGPMTVNVSGNDRISMVPSGGAGGATINLNPGASLTGTLASDVQVHGAAGSTFVNSGNSVFSIPSVLDTDVSGIGTMTVGASPVPNLEFTKSVGAQQSVLDGGVVKIDRPDQFSASISLTSASSAIDLMSLAAADSYTYQNDMLSIWSGNTVIDKLRLHDNTPHGFVVEAPTTGRSVNVAISDPNHVPGGLPVHTMARKSIAYG